MPARMKTLLPEARESVELKDFTTFKIGGPARYFFDATSDEAIARAVTAAEKCEMPFFILGGGTNLLFSDAGFDGLVIHVANVTLEVNDQQISSGAGAMLPELIRVSAESGLAGLESLAGIGGTVGGAVRGNAGAFGQEIGDGVKSVTALVGTKVRKFSHDECEFSYRNSIFKQKNFIILSVRFILERGDAIDLQKRSKEIIDLRNTRYVPEWNSAGCVFKNINLKEVTVDEDRIKKVLDLDDGEYAEATKHGKLPVSFLVDRLGLKGKKIGGAQIAEEHAAFIINTDHAKAEDVITLMSIVKMKVRDNLGIQLEPEIQLVGF